MLISNPKVCILGTCRVGNLLMEHEKYINPYMDSGTQSKIYNYNKIKIHTQPITYTTKLADVRDILKYLQGKIYANKVPNEDINFFNLFFRGLNIRSFQEKILKLPGEIIEGDSNDYDLYVFEVCSLREIIFKNEIYGSEYQGKNLIWNLDAGEHDKTILNHEDFVTVDFIRTAQQCFEEINELCKCKPILIIGPYLLKHDSNEHTKWGEADIPSNDYVNYYRKQVQERIKFCIKGYQNMSYFDMTEYTQTKNILRDQYHFNQLGQKILSDTILSYISTHCRPE